MKTVFLDTSFLIALELDKDSKHCEAVEYWRRTEVFVSILTTSYVFAEVVNFFNNHGEHRKAVQLGNSLLYSPAVELINVDEKLFMDGWMYFCRHADKNYSLADCVSFCLMHPRRLDSALSYDKHFTQAGFLTQPELPGI